MSNNRITENEELTENSIPTDVTGVTEARGGVVVDKKRRGKHALPVDDERADEARVADEAREEKKEADIVAPELGPTDAHTVLDDVASAAAGRRVAENEIAVGGRLLAIGDDRQAGDFLGGPDGAGRDVMQRGDHALNAGLHHVVDRDRILGAEPAPGVPHVLSFPIR